VNLKPAALLSGCAALICLIGAIGSNGWSVFWLAIGAVGFGAEAVALQRPAKDDTLSETIWTKTRPLWIRIPVAVFLVWLVVHWVFGI
jgi:hypothetical protein